MFEESKQKLIDYKIHIEKIYLTKTIKKKTKNTKENIEEVDLGMCWRVLKYMS